MSKYLIHDARTLSEVIDKNIDLIITSPPYFDLKDYGSSNQIGFGQAYAEYLKDMKEVLKQSFIVTKKSGSMWLIVDTLKKEGNFILLPFDLCKIAEEAGWKLQEIVIWKKDRTLPYSRKGEMRNIFEYLLFFIKSNDFKYYPKRITNFDFKEWWVKYPERYSTAGKIPTDIWEFPIPVQGSWGNSYIRHFCPLPSEMIDRIIRLCSDIGDVVFDPFAGSGAVLAEAYKLKRNYIGCDLNPEYKNMFEKYIQTVKQTGEVDTAENRKLYSSTIEKLRIFKFPSVILKALQKNNPELFSKVTGIIVENQKEKPSGKNKHWIIKYSFITKSNEKELLNAVKKLLIKPPLSKYGIEPIVEILNELPSRPNYEYKWAATHLQENKFSGETKPYIASNIRFTKKERDLLTSNI